MFRQHEAHSETKTKKQKADRSVTKHISYPGYLPERIAAAENHTPGYIEDMVIQRRPSDFRKALADEKVSETRSVARFKSYSNWGKVELAMEEYAALPEDRFDTRESKLDKLVEVIDQFRNAEETDETAIAKKPQRLTYCDQLYAEIQNEYAEIANLRVSFPPRSNMEYVKDARLNIETAKKNAGTAISSATGNDGKPNETKDVMFLKDVKRLDITATEISGRWTKGMVARFFDGWSEPDGVVTTNTHEKVKDEEDVSCFKKVGTGFVKKEDVIKVNRTIAQSDYQYKRETADAPLFLDTPKAADVKQGALGDCYLLSAMIAVVSQKPEHFLYHMLDCGDTVIVKMYQSNGTPTFIKVNKSVVVKKNTHNKMFANGALWVPIYEKAYAAAGFTGNNTELPTGGKRSYGFIESGEANIALQHITGKKAEKNSFDPYENLLSNLQSLTTALNNPSTIQGNTIVSGRPAVPPKLKDIEQDVDILFIIAMAIAEAERILHDVFLGVKTLDNDFSQYMQNLENSIKNNATVQSIITAKGVDTKKKNQAISDTVQMIDRFIQSLIDDYMPGTLGKGNYSQEEIRIFTEIRNRLAAGKSVVLSSKPNVSKLLNGQQGAGLSGEGVGGGLVGPHGYAVLDCHITGDLTAPTQLLVLLRNPWGETGRGYFSAPEAASDQRVDIVHRTNTDQVYGAQIEDGEFWIDMSDIVRYFRAMSYIK